MILAPAQAIEFEEVFKVVDAEVFTKIQRHLKDVERFVLWGAWQEQTYDEMATASNYRYTPSYLKQCVGPRLWKLISKALGEEVSKTNFRAAIERRAQLVEALQTQEPAHAGVITNRPTDSVEAVDVSAFYEPSMTAVSTEHNLEYDLHSASHIYKYDIKELPPLNPKTVEPARIGIAIETANGLKSNIVKAFPDQFKTVRQWLPPQLIQLNAGTQSRQQTNQQTIDDYAEQMTEKRWDWKREPLPIVFDDGENLFPGDGHHRVMAALAAGVAEILVEIRQGTVRDAQFYSCGANKYHGLPRTNVDKRNQIELLLSDPEWQMMSNRAISEHCGVSAPLVGKIRSELADLGTVNISSQRVDRKGRKIQTANIGTKAKAKTIAHQLEQQANREPEMLKESASSKLEAVLQKSDLRKEPHKNSSHSAYQSPGAKVTVLMALEHCTVGELREILFAVQAKLETRVV